MCWNIVNISDLSYYEFQIYNTDPYQLRYMGRRKVNNFTYTYDQNYEDGQLFDINCGSTTNRCVESSLTVKVRAVNTAGNPGEWASLAVIQKPPSDVGQ